MTYQTYKGKMSQDSEMYNQTSNSGEDRRIEAQSSGLEDRALKIRDALPVRKELKGHLVDSAPD